MINFAVINLKGILKNLIKVIFLVLLILGTMNIGDLIVKSAKNFSYVDIIKNNICLQSKEDDNRYFKKVIISELPVLADNNREVSKSIQNEEKKENIESVENTEDAKEIDNAEKINETSPSENNTSLRNLPTTVVTENNLSENYNVTYGSVKIKNESSYNLTPEILTPNIDYSNKKDIIIFHTHTCESYTPTENNNYVASGNFRTIDLNYSVAQVGNVLADSLISKGYNVNHSLAYHDYPAYNGSYNRSYNTVKNLLTTMPDTQLVIDLHRDAIGSISNYAPCVKIGNEKVAQIMFVIGTNGGGLEHNGWQNNLKFAVKIQEKANEMYPGLFRPIIVRNSRYNQNLADSAFIIEVGATGNTLEETTGSMKYLAEVISEIFSS